MARRTTASPKASRKPAQNGGGHPAATQETGAAVPPRQLNRGPLPGYYGYNLRIAQTAVFSHFAGSVGNVDGEEISPGRFSLLTLLGANPGINQTDLSRAVGLDKSTLTPALDQLERKGLILRERTVNDRRTYALSLSEKGHGLLRELTRRVERHEEAIVAGLSQGERVMLLKLLKKVARGLRGDAAD